jgi:Right handed beta helix region
LDILVRSSAELKEAFASANDGDVIKLASGDYGSVRLQGRDFNTDVTITSADSGNRAAFDDYLEFDGVSGVTLTNVDIDAASLASAASSSRFQIIKSQDVTIRDISVQGHVPTSSEGIDPGSASRLDPITGFGYENGIRVRWSENVTLEDIEFSDLRQALTISDDSSDTKISNLDVHDVREGINLNDANDTTIEGSRFYDFNPFRSDHPDMIQYWGTDSGVHGLVVRDNLLDQSDGWTQSIFGHFNGRPDHVTGSDFVITGNTIINAHANAIRIREIDGFEISDNLLLPNDPNYDYRRLPQITVLDSENGEVSGNSLLPRWDGSIVNLSDDALQAANINLSGNVALSSDPGNEFYWAGLRDGDVPTISSSEDEEGAIDELPEDPEAAPDDLVEGEAPQPEQPIEDETGRVEEDEVVVDEGNSGVEEPAEDVDPAPAEPAEDDQTEADLADGGDDLVAEPETEEPSAEDEPVPAGNTDIEVSQVDVAGTSGADSLSDEAGSTSRDGTDTGSAPNVLADLDFAEGDQLVPVGNEKGTFNDGADPENDLATLYGGSRDHIRSEDDLREAAPGTESQHGDSLIVTPSEVPDRSVELLGISPDDFIM